MSVDDDADQVNISPLRYLLPFKNLEIIVTLDFQLPTQCRATNKKAEWLPIRLRTTITYKPRGCFCLIRKCMHVLSHITETM